MNDLYPLIEKVINLCTKETVNNLIQELNQKTGDKSTDYGCGANVFYVLRRLLGAALARDPKIKSIAQFALKAVVQQVKTIEDLNKTAFASFFISNTDLKDCKSKPDTNAYIGGKILIIKTLPQYFKGNDKVIAHFVELIAKHEQFQEQFIEILHILSEQKFSKLKFTVTKQKSKSMVRVLSGKKMSQEDICLTIKQALQSYPKQCVSLKHIGQSLSHLVGSPQLFFKKNYQDYINPNADKQEDADLKVLFYLLQIQKYFLKVTEITKQNMNTTLGMEMIVIWMEQLRVKNKHMRELTSSMTINFSNDPEFSFEILTLLHQKKIYLENINAKHPFAQLYANVDANKYEQYLIKLIQSNEPSEEMQEQGQTSKKEEYLSQLEYLARQRLQSLTNQQVAKTLSILIVAYQKSKKSQKLLNLVWNLFHQLSQGPRQTKKKIVLNTKGALTLNKIKLSDLQLQQTDQQFISKVIKFLKIKVKENKQSNSKIVISFLNFIISLVIYTIVYPQESQICAEIQFISKDLETFLASQTAAEQGKDALKKKRKKSQQVQDRKKPIHVLVEVFISLLTKAPIFLRNTINHLFEQLVPYFDKTDIETLLDVIQKPDQQYIQEI